MAEMARPNTALSVSSVSCRSCPNSRPDTACTSSSRAYSASSMALSSLPPLSVASSCSGSELAALVQRKQQIRSQLQRIQLQLDHACSARSEVAGDGRPRQRAIQRHGHMLRAKQAELQYQMRRVALNSAGMPKTNHAGKTSAAGYGGFESSKQKTMNAESLYVLTQRDGGRQSVVGALEPGRYAFWPKTLPGSALARRGQGRGSQRNSAAQRPKIQTL